MHLYDYQRIDPSNPRQVASDEALPNVGEPNLSSTAVAFWFYTVGGFLVYFATRLTYDTEWDRYYHVYYPASMEYFDVLSVYYVEKMKSMEERIPRSWQDLVPSVLATPTYKRWQQTKALPQTKKEEEALVDVILATLQEADKIPQKIDEKREE